MNIKQQIKRLIRNECACYDPSTNGIIYIKNIPQSITIKDYCDREREKDCRCSIFKNKRYSYFERAVLPMNPQLEALYIAEHKARQINYKLSKEDKKRIVEEKSSVAGKVKIHCKKCKDVFLANNYRSQYCDKCKKYLNRERWRESKSKKRQINVNVHNQLSEIVDL